MDLPARPMTSDELRGFNLALACLMRWGSQIERNGISLGGPDNMVPRSQMMAHGGRMVRWCAEALAITEGKRQRQPAAPQLPASASRRTG